MIEGLVIMALASFITGYAFGHMLGRDKGEKFMATYILTQLKESGMSKKAVTDLLIERGKED